ncbi:hypothetical protein [Caulobacter sp.]|uniref:hypothetical protein n=1 Tax=Caulobacter sp. TaxID=78 RepID=UPI002B470EF2|nr:hypothetical protein [Caulobacter sp.]HJV40377.1 hypothetical protein [Caulobacter sp.]
MREFDLDAARLQSALTRRFLLPALSALEATFLALRAETDQALAVEAGGRYGRPYPYGMCLEITVDVLQRLNARPARPRSAGERALKAFFDNGGRGRQVWGVLRDRYFQNAIQLGSLYVDVSNDTVDVRKAKVEILPMRDSGLVLVRDGAHFARIGRSYWNGTFYANTALPTLAPAFPMIVVDQQGRIQMQTKTAYMMRLFAADGFHLAERWLREGPRPPTAVVQAMRAGCRPEMLAANPTVGVDAALLACARLRAAGTVVNEAWISSMQALFDRVPATRIAMSAPIASHVDIRDKRWTNARPTARIEGVPA